jgi:hypothetical protein
VDLKEDLAYGPNSPLWDRWLDLGHDLRRHAYFASQPPAKEVEDDNEDVYAPFVVNQE